MKILRLLSFVGALVFSGITGPHRVEAQRSLIAVPVPQGSDLVIQTVAIPSPIKQATTKERSRARDTDLFRTSLVLIKLHNHSVVLNEGWDGVEVVSAEVGQVAESLMNTPDDAKDSSNPVVQNTLHSFRRDRPTFVLTHGMGGTKTGDRFHRLADAICKAMPECNVLMIDWTRQSSHAGLFGIPNPFGVAQNIDPVGRDAAELLKTLKIDPVRTTFIGESFGNYVNARVASTLGGRGRILAFNPATAMSGYKVPDLRACSDVAWSFHTYSIFDTQDSIADLGIFLETTPNATEVDKHIFGVSWLAERVSNGDLAWLQTAYDIGLQQAEYFDAIATLSGEILHQHVPRKRLAPSQENAQTTHAMLASTSQGGIHD